MTISRNPTIHGERYRELEAAATEAHNQLLKERYREELILDFAAVLRRVVFDEDPDNIVLEAYKVFAGDETITPEMRDVALKFANGEQ